MNNLKRHLVYAKNMTDHKNLSVYRAAEYEFVLIARYLEFIKAMMSVKRVKFSSLSMNIQNNLNRWLKK